MVKRSWNFVSPHPPDGTKIVRARQALTHRPGPISPPPVPERRLEWPLSLNLGFVIFPCCFGRLFVDWPGSSGRICSLTSSLLLGFEERARQEDPLSLLVTRPRGLEAGKMVTGTAPGLVGKPCDLGNVSGRRGAPDARARSGLHLSKS